MLRQDEVGHQTQLTGLILPSYHHRFLDGRMRE
jgi:hypothetical protein